LDRSAGSAVIVREAARFGTFGMREVDLTLPVNTYELDVRHRYEVEAKVFERKRVTHRATAPMLTYGAPYSVELRLVASP
jgi:hypothetical protein